MNYDLYMTHYNVNMLYNKICIILLVGIIYFKNNT